MLECLWSGAPGALDQRVVWSGNLKRGTGVKVFVRDLHLSSSTCSLGGITGSIARWFDLQENLSCTQRQLFFCRSVWYLDVYKCQFTFSSPGKIKLSSLLSNLLSLSLSCTPLRAWNCCECSSLSLPPKTDTWESRPVCASLSKMSSKQSRATRRCLLLCVPVPKLEGVFFRNRQTWYLCTGNETKQANSRGKLQLLKMFCGKCIMFRAWRLHTEAFDAKSLAMTVSQEKTKDQRWAAKTSTNGCGNQSVVLMPQGPVQKWRYVPGLMRRFMWRWIVESPAWWLHAACTPTHSRTAGHSDQLSGRWVHLTHLEVVNHRKFNVVFLECWLQINILSWHKGIESAGLLCVDFLRLDLKQDTNVGGEESSPWGSRTVTLRFVLKVNDLSRSSAPVQPLVICCSNFGLCDRTVFVCGICGELGCWKVCVDLLCVFTWCMLGLYEAQAVDASIQHCESIRASVIEMWCCQAWSVVCSDESLLQENVACGGSRSVPEAVFTLLTCRRFFDVGVKM